MSATMTQDALGWVLADAFMMDTKSFGGYVKLVGYISRIGSAPTDDRDLATILGVTVGYLRKRAWPLIRHLFVDQGDGRMTHPRVQQMPPAPKNVAPTLSESRRAAGRAGGLKRVANLTNGQANPQANGQANPQANPSKIVANSTPVASDFASDLPEFATPVAPASPSLPSSLLASQPTEREEESKEGGTGGGDRASAGGGQASQANRQANPQANPGPVHLNGQAKSPRYTPLADDWQPTPEAVEALTAMGHDPGHVARKYRLWCRDNNKHSRDHDAAFELFYLKEDRHTPAQRSATLARSFSGGKPDKPDKGAFLTSEFERIAARRRVSNGADMDEGPIIDEEAG